MKSQAEIVGLLHQYKTEHADEYGIKRMGIFGSVARGEQKKESDIDVYIESDTISLLDMGGLLLDLKDLLKTDVDLVHKHKYLKPSFIQRIENEMIYV